jgi:hypothetical protein
MDGTINKIEFRQLLLYINYFQPRWDCFERGSQRLPHSILSAFLPS